MRPATKGFLQMAFVYAVAASVVVLCFAGIAFWYGDTFH